MSHQLTALQADVLRSLSALTDGPHYLHSTATLYGLLSTMRTIWTTSGDDREHARRFGTFHDTTGPVATGIRDLVARGLIVREPVFDRPDAQPHPDDRYVLTAEGRAAIDQHTIEPELLEVAARRLHEVLDLVETIQHEPAGNPTHCASRYEEVSTGLAEILSVLARSAVEAGAGFQHRMTYVDSTVVHAHTLAFPRRGVPVQV
jgi:hypothetical protein